MNRGAFSYSSYRFKWEKFLSFAVLLTVATPCFADVTNPWHLAVDERILNRKHVSHIVLETRPGGYRITLLLSERFPYSYKSKSAPFFIRVSDAKSGLELAEKLDAYLERGYNIRIRLNGSEIVEYELDESIE